MKPAKIVSPRPTATFVRLLVLLSAPLAAFACAPTQGESADDAANATTSAEAIDSDDAATADEPTLSSPATGRRRIIGPADDFDAALSALEPGDTLFLRPGTYSATRLHIKIRPGTPTAQIHVTAADRAHPPLVRGMVHLRGASYWHLSFMRIVGTVGSPPKNIGGGKTEPGIGQPTVWFFGGRGWSIRHCEIWGAGETMAFGNLAIFDDAPEPSTLDVYPNGFAVEYNCIHDAGRGEIGRNSQFHNIYIGAHAKGKGLATSVISRNIFFNAPAGEHVKIGEGPLDSPDTIRGVEVLYNTMSDSGVAGVLSGGYGVGNEVLKGNLIDRVAGSSGPRPAFYLRNVDEPDAVFIAHNYAHDVGQSGGFVYFGSTSKSGSYIPGNLGKFPLPEEKNGDNRVGADPQFDDRTCKGFHPKNPEAAKYGRYSTVVY